MSEKAPQKAGIRRRMRNAVLLATVCCLGCMIAIAANAAASPASEGGLLHALLAPLHVHIGVGAGSPPGQQEGGAAPPAGGPQAGHWQGSQPSPGQPGQPGPWSQHGGPGNGQEAGTAGPPPAPPQPASGGHGWWHGGNNGKQGQQGQPEQGAGGGAGTGGEGHHYGRGQGQQGGAPTTQTASPSPASGAATHGGQAPEASGQASTATASQPSPPSSPASSPTASTASAAPASPAPSSTGAGSAAPTPTQGKAPHRASHIKRAGRNHRHRGASKAGGGAVAGGHHLAAANVTPTADVNRSRSLVASGETSHHRAHPAKNGAAQPSRLPPVVRTITRIVSVVPLPLRILIGALIAFAIALGVRSRIIASRTKRLEQQRSELLEDVGLLQAALLPSSPQRLGAVGASTAYRPAGGPAAGGDFYDLFALEDGRLAVILGDVSGHGRQALPHTAITRFTLRAYLEAGCAPRETLQTAGAALERQLGDSFATVVLAIYQPRDRTLTYACAGHPHPLLIASEPVAPVIASAAPPIGAGMQTGTRQTVISLPGATQICLYTDGVTDARVGSELYGTERLQRALRELGPKASASELLDRIAEQTDRRPDDMAACLLSIGGASEPPRVLCEQLQLDAEQVSSARAKRFLLACGVAEHRVRGILEAAKAEALRSGSTLIEVRPASAGQPEVDVQPSNVTAIHSVKMKRELAGAR